MKKAEVSKRKMVKKREKGERKFKTGMTKKPERGNFSD